MAQKEIPYPDDLLMNWVDLLRPIGFNDVMHRHDDEHLFNERWALQNSPEYQILAARAQTFPLRYRVGDKSKSNPLGGIMTNRAGHSQLVGDIAELLGKKVGAKISRRIRKTMDTGGLGEIRTHHFMSILRIASLGHDLGSPPFAHPGEYAVREWACEGWRQNIFRGRLTRAQLLDLQTFDANANALNILINAEVFTFPVMASIAKYPNGSGDNPDYCYKAPKYGYLERDAGKFEIIAETLGMIKSDDRGGSYYLRHPLVYLLEAADDIAYLIHDFRDALKGGFYEIDMNVGPEELTASPEEIQSARSVEQIFYYLTGMHFDDHSLNGHGRGTERQQVNRRLSKMEPAVVDICTDAIAQAFLDNELDILNGKKFPGLVDLAVLPTGEMGPIYNAIRHNFRSTVIDEVDKIRNPYKGVIITILDAFCMSYFSITDLKTYGTPDDHQIAQSSLTAVKGFLDLVNKYDNQGEAKFSFESSFSDFIQDVLRWLCQQGDNDIVRLGNDMENINDLRPSLQAFQERFQASGQVKKPSRHRNHQL